MDSELINTGSIALALAIFAALLSILNTWHALDRSRLNLKITPAHAFPLGAVDPSINFSIEVTNLSEFAVTIQEVGILYEGTKKPGTLLSPILLDGGTWPRRLESRTAVSVYAQAPLPNGGPRIRCVYARTACGQIITGNSPALQQIAGRSAKGIFLDHLMFGR